MNDDHQIAEILELMQVPEWSGVYALGCYGRYITVYSQQVRALNLTYALRKSGALDVTSKIAVIGAGVAGLTAAVAAFRLGASVTLLEKLPTPMGIQKGSTQRFLHPHIYDWPAMELEEESAGLPVLDWTAAPVDEVVEQLERQWDVEVKRSKRRISPHWNVSEVAIEPANKGQQISVTWNDPKEGPHAEEFDLVILAVGFGKEPDLIGSLHGYWEDDRLTKVSDRTRKCLVSGSGDGGLTDLMQLCIKEFRHDLIVRMFASDPKSLEVGSDLLKLEEQYRDKDNRALSKHYQNLNVPHVQESLTRVLRSDTQVYLTGRSFWEVYGPKSSILNRFIVSQLARLKAWKWIAGPIQLPPIRRDNQHIVRFGKNNVKEVGYDILVIRHGPKPVLEQDFPEIWQACKELAMRWRRLPQHLDPTRKRLAWKNIFDSSENSEPLERTQPEHFRLVAFDLDGTLLRGDDYVWSWPLVWKHLGYEDQIRKNLMAEYLEKRHTHKHWYKEWCDRSAALFKKKGLKRADFSAITKTLKPVDGLRDTLQKLKENGFKLAIVSGGIDIFLDEILPDYKELFDYIYINRFRFDNEGDFQAISATRYDFEGKTTAIEEICNREGFSMEHVAFVGDGFNDAHVLRKVGRTIAFVPSSAEMRNADITIKDPDLRNILPFILRELGVRSETIPGNSSSECTAPNPLEPCD